MRSRPFVALLLCAALVLTAAPASPCTSILVSRGATTDGSTMITYAADSHTLYGELYMTPAGVHAPGALRDVIEWDTGKFLGRIPQAPVTYQTIGNMNEHQVAITESTWGGRKELAGPAGIIDYGSLIWIALERSKTAREAIRTMAALVDEHGYASTGESFSISDPNEVWLMELIGKGKDRKGAVWVAVRVPDGYLTAHANHARIARFPLADPQNALYSKDVVSFAREKGWFSGKDEDFSFVDAYAPFDFGALRFCDARVWSIFRRAAPSLRLPVEMVKGDLSAERLPLWIEPERKLALADVMALMRDHYQGTELDMTKDVGAGPFGLPYR
jgi:dipeptidase